MLRLVDRWLDKLEGLSPESLNYEQTLAIGRSNFLGVVRDAKKILFTGSADPQVISKVCGDFCGGLRECKAVDAFSQDPDEIEIYCGRSLLNDPQTILAAKHCDGVVFVEQRKKSRICNIDKSAKAVEDLNVSLLGFILV